jgi:hypothetical protein
VPWISDLYGYFEQKVDPAHPEKMNSNRGCCIDPMYGQAYAAQLGLPRVFPADKSKVALGNIFRNNFLPDSSSYSRTSGIPGGRVYSVAGEAARATDAPHLQPADHRYADHRHGDSRRDESPGDTRGDRRPMTRQTASA